MDNNNPDIKDYVIESLDRIISALINKNEMRDAIEQSIHLLENYKIVPKGISKIFTWCIDQGYRKIVYLLKILPDNKEAKALKYQWGEKAIAYFIKKGWINSAVEVSGVLQRKLSDSELRKLLLFLVKSDSSYADQVISTSKMLEHNPVIIEEAICIILNKKNDWQAHKAIELAKFPGIKKEIIDKVFDRFSNPKSFFGVDCFNNLIPNKEKERWSIMLNNYVEKGSFPEAKKAAQKIHRQLLPEELRKLLEKNIEKGWHNSAIEIAEEMGRKLSTSEVREILEVGMKKGDYKVVASSSKFLNEEVEISEKRKLIEGLISRDGFRNVKEAIEILFPGEVSLDIREEHLVSVMNFLSSDPYYNSELFRYFKEFSEKLSLENQIICAKMVLSAKIKRMEKNDYIYLPDVVKVVKVLEKEIKSN